MTSTFIPLSCFSGLKLKTFNDLILYRISNTVENSHCLLSHLYVGFHLHGEEGAMGRDRKLEEGQGRCQWVFRALGKPLSSVTKMTAGVFLRSVKWHKGGDLCKFGGLCL